MIGSQNKAQDKGTYVLTIKLATDGLPALQAQLGFKGMERDGIRR